MTTIPPSVTTPLPSAVQTGTRVIEKGDDGTDKQMFLKLMIAQLRNQDPTAPMDQKDMMASITQFSQMEQMQNMSTAMETLSLAQGTGLMGKEIEYNVTVKDANGQVLRQAKVRGVVEDVQQTSSGIKLLMKREDGVGDETPQVSVSPADVTTVFGS